MQQPSNSWRPSPGPNPALPDNRFNIALISGLTAVLGYAANFIASWLYPQVFQTLPMLIVLVLFFPLSFYFCLRIKLPGVLPFMELFYGFAIGLTQSISANWVTSDSAWSGLRLAIGMLAVLMLFVPNAIRYANSKNSSNVSVLGQILSGIVGWVFLSCEEILRSYIILYSFPAKQTPVAYQWIQSNFLLLCGLYIVVVLSVPFISGMIISYCARGKASAWVVVLSWLASSITMIWFVPTLFLGTTTNNIGIACMSIAGAIILLGVMYAGASFGSRTRLME